MAYYLSPIFQDAQLDSVGAPLVGGQLEIYDASTSTPRTVYKDNAGAAEHTNPIILNARGEPPAPIWLLGSFPVKFILKTAAGATIRTIDNVSGVNEADVTTTVSEWQSSGLTPTYVSATSFTVTGNQTATLHPGRRIKTTNTGGTRYSVIASSAYTSLTTVTVTNDSGTLDSGLSLLYYSILSADNSAVPVVTDDQFAVSDGADPTKKYKLSLGNLTTSTTRTRTILDRSAYEALSDDIVGLHNCYMTATVSGNNLTFALKTLAGNDPSSADPAFVGFRSATATSGAQSVVQVTAATSFTVTAGSTLGFSNSESGRIWVCAINNAGTVELAAYRAWSSTGWLRINEGIISTTAEGSGTADSALTLYSSSARSNVAMRYIGYCEIQYGTAAWSNNPTVVQTHTSHMPRPGDIVQRKYTTTSAYATGTDQVPDDDTIPQSDEGTSFMTLAITPTSALNLLEIEAQGLFTASGAGEYITTSLFNGGSSAIACVVSSQNAADPQPTRILYQAISGQTSSITYSVLAGTANGANATYFNGWAAARKRGGIMNSFIRINEVFV